MNSWQMFNVVVQRMLHLYDTKYTHDSLVRSIDIAGIIITGGSTQATASVELLRQDGTLCMLPSFQSDPPGSLAGRYEQSKKYLRFALTHKPVQVCTLTVRTGGVRRSGGRRLHAADVFSWERSLSTSQ